MWVEVERAKGWGDGQVGGWVGGGGGQKKKCSKNIKLYREHIIKTRKLFIFNYAP